MPKTTHPGASDASGVIDLDARKAARLERTGPKVVRWGGEEWRFRPEFPMQSIADFTSGNLVMAFRRILEEPEMAADFLAAGDLSQKDFQELMMSVYGLDLGNS